MADTVIQNPTYMEHVRHFFDEVDLQHMYWKATDFTTYKRLRSRGNQVYFQTRPPNANMPPEPDRKWSAERSRSFLNWIRDDYPIGQPVLQPPQTGNAERVRRDARDLSDDEVDKLRRAFRGVMDKDPDDPTSYFTLAGIHWYPEPTYCVHREDRYNPWHRVYLTQFENALRTVEGCEDVTLPYWDITSAPPDFLYEPPFDSYTLPQEVDPAYPAGHTTSRNDAQTIASLVAIFDIPTMIENSMRQFKWGDFNDYTKPFIVAAHDSGHGACGGSMADTDIASFDPLFWFFHANWDRLWWEWQQIMQATTLWTFFSTLGPLDPADPDADDEFSTEFLEKPLNSLKPFSLTADQVIDLSAMNVDYARPTSFDATAAVPTAERASFGRFAAARRMRVHPEPKVSVRLKGINRLVIRGSFQAILKANGEPIARRVFFQSTQPRTCAACRAKAVVNLDFLVESAKVTGSELTVDIETVTSHPGMDPRIPLRACGNPTLNVRMLLQEAY